MYTATVYQLNATSWVATRHTGEGETQAEANAAAAYHVPLGYGGHNRSDRAHAAIAAGSVVSAPLGTYQIRDEGSK